MALKVHSAGVMPVRILQLGKSAFSDEVFLNISARPLILWEREAVSIAVNAQNLHSARLFQALELLGGN